MFCPHCGAEQPEESPKFCLKCGAPLTKTDSQKVEQPGASVSASEPASASAPEPAPSPAPEPASEPAPAPTPVSAQEPASAASQTPVQGDNAAASRPKLNSKLIAIVAAAIVAVVVIVVLVVNSNKPAETSAPAPTATTEPAPTATTEPAPDPAPEPGLTTEEKRAFFVGTWVCQDSSDPSLSPSWFASQAAEGVYITLIFWDDGTGVFRTDGGPEKFTWEAQTAIAATVTIDGEDHAILLRGKKLTMTNPAGMELYFVPESEVDMSNAVDLTWQGQGVTVDPSTIQVTEYSKLIGNYSVGFMQVPENWVNRIDDIDPEFVKNQEAVYYVDSKSEYTSPSLGHFAFSQSVEMSRHSASYTDLAQQLVDAYKADDSYSDVVSGRMTIGKRRAILITCTNKADGVNVMCAVIDRDNDNKVSVVLSFNAGTVGDNKPVEWATAFMNTWQVE